MTVAREPQAAPDVLDETSANQRAGRDRRSSERRRLTRTVDMERRSGPRRIAPSRRAEDYSGDRRGGRDRRRMDRRSGYPVNTLEERRMGERRADGERRRTPAQAYIPGVFLREA